MEWIQRTTESYDQPIPEELAGRFSHTFSRLLAAKGIQRLKEAEAFLHPERQPLPEPDVLIDIDLAVGIILDAVTAHERICVYGDYDVDGICATTILYRALRKRGADVMYYIPDRDSEGYGMHEDSVRKLAEKGVRLLVTVDNGISAHAEAQLARSLGMRVVVTDHHRCHDVLPDADAVVCATRPGQSEDTAGFCGASVAMFLAKQMGDPYEEHLALAALATVADVMPLTGTNRVIVARGIPLLGNEPGISALLSVADAGARPVTETTLSFLLAPRLNAAGRMGDASRAVRLLISGDETERRELAMELDSENAARKTEEMRILSEAESRIGQTEPMMIMLHGADWNPGVIGIVASRLCETHRCPVLLFTGEGETLRGSGRSIPKVDLFELLSAHETYLEQFGGHAQAAGATVRTDRFDTCRSALEKYLSDRFPEGYPEEPVFYEDTLPVSECTVQLCEEIELLAPFGEQNPEPLFRLKGELSGVSLMGKDGAHLTASVSDGGERLRLVGFRIGTRTRALTRVRDAEILCTLKKNSFRDTVSVNGYIVRIRADVSEPLRKAAESFLACPSDENVLAIRKASGCTVSEDDIRRDFSFLRQGLKRGLPMDDLNEPELIAMLILFEADILHCSQGMLFEVPVTGKKQIQNGRLYSVMCS